MQIEYQGLILLPFGSLGGRGKETRDYSNKGGRVWRIVGRRHAKAFLGKEKVPESEVRDTPVEGLTDLALRIEGKPASGGGERQASPYLRVPLEKKYQKEGGTNRPEVNEGRSLTGTQDMLC